MNKPWWVLGLVLALGAAGGWAWWSRSGPAKVPPVAAAPDATPPPTSAGEDGGPRPADAWGNLAWPQLHYGKVPLDRQVKIPGVVSDLALAPQGDEAYLVRPDGQDWSLARWRFEAEPTPIPIAGRAHAAAASGFDGTLYVLAHDGPEWQLLKLPRGPNGLGEPQVLYRSPSPLSELICPTVLWNGEERCFFAAEHQAGSTQILSVRRTGLAVYELTSPDGQLGARTDPALRTRDDPELSPPAVAKARSAQPLSIDPATGTLIYRAEGRLFQRRYVDQNWEAPRPLAAPAGVNVTSTPNGWFELHHHPKQGGVGLAEAGGPELLRIGGAERFRGVPEVAANGRALVAAIDQGESTVIRSYPIPHPLAPVRFLRHVAPRIRADLAEHGWSAWATQDTQLYQEYERRTYDLEHPVPVYAAIDGVLEVLGAGFQAVFMLAERDLSRPKLRALLSALEAAATRDGLGRVANIADRSRRMLDGDYAHEEGRLVLAEAPATSSLHTVPKAEPIDFADFHPRGSYTTSKDLESYFRAFKYFNLLALTDEERQKLAQDPAVVAALDAWIAVQDPFVWPARRTVDLLGRPQQLPPYVRPDCLPNRVKEQPPHPFPLAFGIDSEILESTVSRLGVASDCTTHNEEPYRKLPSGLDLLTGLGSAEARRRVEPEYSRHPELAAVHTQLAARFGQALGPEALGGPRGRFVGSWLRLVQLLANEEHLPEGVSPERWRGRLLETALGTWVNLRHTTVLVNEGTGAEMGGAWFGFELLETEPPRGVIDPLPEAWRHLASMLEALEGWARPIDPAVAKELAAVAASTRRYADLAAQQRAGEPLGDPGYEAINSYGRAIEHPFLKLQAALHPMEGIAGPDPMIKIVDVQSWKVPGETQIWHVAVGRPQAVTVLLGDRGVLVPGHGAVYSYHEVVAERPLDDQAFRAVVDRTPRPAWLPPIRTATTP